MQIVIHGEKPFRCQKDTFAVAGTETGYTLNYSVDKMNWTEWDEATPANEELVVNGVTPFMWFKLVGVGETDVNAIV